jgi:3-hydroxy-3-methylglutaryl CoA synthase
VREIRTTPVLPPFEDSVTLAANAARPIVESAGAFAFGMLIVAAETGVDCGKPLSSYLHKQLGLSPSCRDFEIKHASYAGTAALRLASSCVRSQDRADGAQALFMMTDIARRPIDARV